MAHATSVKKHRCSYCSQMYAKAEHLVRHERTHTGSRPFVCAECQRTFSRQDSLLRHAKRHKHRHSLESQPNDSLTLPLPVSHSQQPVEAAFSVDNINLLSPNTHSSIQGGLSAINEHSITDSTMPFSTQDDPNIDSFMQLTWPDAEDLLQSILSADFAQLPQTLEVLHAQPMLQAVAPTETETSSPWISTDGTTSGHGGTHAIRDLSQMIANLSSNITAEAESAGLTTIFLDGSLHMFFSQFVKSFPIVHRPTFVFKDWTHPLLLNAIALGSLFTGQKDNIPKGEMLWRLAHTAVATSWHTLIRYRGEFDASEGVQLVLTALFGQAYAMLSRDNTLRQTAQVFHSLGFYWARECGMFGISKPDIIPLPELTEEQALRQWRNWAARETQLRALLGHYILDGQLAQFTGAPTCQRHASNPLPLPCSDALFRISNLAEWKVAMPLERSTDVSFRDVFNSLFSASIHRPYLSSNFSPLTIGVILEGLYSFVAENGPNSRPIVGMPSILDVWCALGRLYNCIAQNSTLSDVDKSEAMLRWHAIGLESATDSGRLCRMLCQQFNVQQNVLGGRLANSTEHNIRLFSKSIRAKRSLLHAIAIRDILQDLPLGRAHAIHVPSSIFAATTIYAGFLNSGTISLNVPHIENWESLMALDLDAQSIDDFFVTEDPSFQRIKQFLFSNGEITSTNDSNKHLLYDFNSFSIHLKRLNQPWGISSNMQNIVEHWTAHLNS